MRIVYVSALTCLAILAHGAAAAGQTWDWAGQIATFSSGGDAATQVTAITVDPNENVFITGNYGDSVLIGGTKLKAVSVGDDMYVARLNSSGQFAWAKSFGSGDASDKVIDITSDSDGNVYVCGYFTGQIILDSIHLNGVSISNIALAKYNSSGDVVWARLVWNALQGPGGLVYDHGYIYAAVNHTLAKYRPNGDTVWTRTVPDNVALPVEFNHIAADSAGNLYLTGEFTGRAIFGTDTLHAASFTDVDIMTVKYDSLGNVVWARRAGSVSSPIQEEVGRGIAVSKSGYVYVVGQYVGKAFFDTDSVQAGTASTGMFIAKYTTDGAFQWVKGGSGPTSTSSTAFSVKVLANDDILVEGDYFLIVTIADTTFHLTGGEDVLMLRLAPDGTLRWGKRSDTFIPVCSGFGLALNGAGTSAYVGGQFSTSVKFGSTTMSTATGVADDGWIAKMSIGAITDVSDNSNHPLPRSSSLSQNYPNPFNPTTTILYSLQERGHVSLSIYNILGQKVKTLVDETQPAGRYDVGWDGRNGTGAPVASGVYFYKLTTGKLTASKKMVLLK